MKDHLGNTRVTYSENGQVLQTADYYPFGMRHSGMANLGTDNKYLYNGKELQEDTEWYDYGARHYDPAIGRFMTQDPMAIDYYSLSPYNYLANNPLKYIDPTGMWITGIQISEDEDGNKTATLIAIQEEGDDLASLAEFLGIDEDEAKETHGSSFDKKESDEDSEDSPLNIAVQGEAADAVNDAFTHALNKPSEYEESFGSMVTRLFGLDVDYEIDFGSNYNCYQGATSIAQGNNVNKDHVLYESDLNKTINENFTGNVGKDGQKYGKTVVLYDSMYATAHAAVYLGTDNAGNDYHFYKGGKVEAPMIIKASETPKVYGTVQSYHNAK